MADSHREDEARPRREQPEALEALAIQSTSGKASPGKLAILIDGGCALCRDSADKIRRWDSIGAIEILDLQDPAHRARFSQFSLDRLLEELHAVDDSGRVYRGSDAINQILRRQHGFAGALSCLWYIPGFARLADRQYKRIAASRYGSPRHART